MCDPEGDRGSHQYAGTAEILDQDTRLSDTTVIPVIHEIEEE